MGRGEELGDMKQFVVDTNAQAGRYALRLASVFGLHSCNAEDARNEAYLVLFEKWDRLDHPVNIGYLFGIIKHVLHDFVRAKTKTVVADEEAAIAVLDHNSAEDMFFLRDKAMRVLEAMRVLTEEELDVLLMTMDGMKAPTIAANLNMTPDAVRQRLSRTKRKLRMVADDVDEKHA